MLNAVHLLQRISCMAHVNSAILIHFGLTMFGSSRTSQKKRKHTKTWLLLWKYMTTTLSRPNINFLCVQIFIHSVDSNEIFSGQILAAGLEGGHTNNGLRNLIEQHLGTLVIEDYDIFKNHGCAIRCDSRMKHLIDLGADHAMRYTT